MGWGERRWGKGARQCQRADKSHYRGVNTSPDASPLTPSHAPAPPTKSNHPYQSPTPPTRTCSSNEITHTIHPHHPHVPAPQTNSPIPFTHTTHTYLLLQPRGRRADRRQAGADVRRIVAHRAQQSVQPGLERGFRVRVRVSYWLLEHRAQQSVQPGLE